MNVFDLISQFARYVHRLNDKDVVQMCGLAQGTTATKIQTTNKIYYNIYNKNYSFVATDNITVTSCVTQAISTFCYYLVSIDVSGNVTTTKGTDKTFLIPSTPAGDVPIGVFLITTDASDTFTAGTTAFNATGITTVFYDIDCGVALSLINMAQKRLERGVTITRNGRQKTIMDFDHMITRAQVSLLAGDSSVVLPFVNYKAFVEGEITLTDTSGLITSLEKQDMPVLGIQVATRPSYIGYLPVVTTVFTPDGFPGKEFIFDSICDQDYTLDVSAYCYSPDLDGVLYQTNWLTSDAPDILLFGGLVETASYMDLVDPRMPEWKQRWEDAIWTLYTAQQKEHYQGSPIHTKFPNPIGKGESLGLSSNKAGIYSFGIIND